MFLISSITFGHESNCGDGLSAVWGCVVFTFNIDVMQKMALTAKRKFIYVKGNVWRPTK